VRERRLRIPREHGAWAMLLAAAALAWALPAVRGWPAAVLTFLFVVAFAIQEPLRAVAVGRGDRAALLWIGIYGAVLLAGAGWLVVECGVYALVPAAILGIGFTAVDLVKRRRGRHRGFLFRLAGGAGLTLVLPATVAVAHPGWVGYALGVWGLTLAYFATRMVAIRRRNEARRQSPAAPAWTRAVLLSQIGLYVVLVSVVVLGAASPWLLLAFVPGSVAALRTQPDRDLRTVGWLEVAHLGWFVAAVIVSYHLG